VISLPNASLAIRPDGSSAALLIRKPVLKRVNAVCRDWLVWFKAFWAKSELTFVLIRVMREAFL
jgi:hypothetical protein